MNTNIQSGLLVLCLTLALLGCESSGPSSPSPGEVMMPGQQDDDEGRPQVRDAQIADPVSGETLSGLFYFDYDQALVRRAGHAELKKHAEALADDRSLRLRLEGHADERGTREYNLALGERRANAIRAFLVAQGASGSQLEVVSFGEEKPVNPGHNEAAWAQNRRVQLIYR